MTPIINILLGSQRLLNISKHCEGWQDNHWSCPQHISLAKCKKMLLYKCVICRFATSPLEVRDNKWNKMLWSVETNATFKPEFKISLSDKVDPKHAPS